MKKIAVILLGVNGTLSGAIIDAINSKHADSIDMYGFDVQPTTEHKLASYRQCDLASRESITAALATLPFGKYKDMRLLICAAKMNPSTFNENMELDVDMLYERLQINIVGQAHFATDFAMRCVKAGVRGRVVAIGSTAAYVGSSDLAYATAKAGLDGMVRSLSKYLAQKGVVAYAVHTGIFESNMEAQVSEARKAVTIGMTHIKRKARLEEITTYVMSYLFEVPEFATGQCVDISGGQHT